MAQFPKVSASLISQLLPLDSQLDSSFSFVRPNLPSLAFQPLHSPLLPGLELQSCFLIWLPFMLSTAHLHSPLNTTIPVPNPCFFTLHLVQGTTSWFQCTLPSSFPISNPFSGPTFPARPVNTNPCQTKPCSDLILSGCRRETNQVTSMYFQISTPFLAPSVLS